MNKMMTTKTEDSKVDIDQIIDKLLAVRGSKPGKAVILTE